MAPAPQSLALRWYPHSEVAPVENIVEQNTRLLSLFFHLVKCILLEKAWESTIATSESQKVNCLGLKVAKERDSPYYRTSLQVKLGWGSRLGVLLSFPGQDAISSQRYPRSSHSSLISSSFRDSSPHPIILPTWVETGTVKVSNFV